MTFPKVSVEPTSMAKASQRAAAPWRGPLAGVVAAFQNIAMIAGAFRIAISAIRRATVDGVADGQLEFCAACLAATLLAVALVLIAGFKYDVWSCFQARLAFHAFFGIALCLAVGVTWARTRWPHSGGWWIAAAMLLLSLLNGAYFLTECGLDLEVLLWCGSMCGAA